MYRRILEEALPEVRERIRRSAEQSGRSAEDVRLVAVTKGHPFEAVEAALDAGLVDLGENRVDELEAKAARAVGRRVRWHMIGRLQRRQAPGVWGLADMVHSIDSLRLAERLERTAPDEAGPLKVLMQVNVSGESSKAGIEPADAREVLGAMVEMNALDVVGLMTMAPFSEDPGVLRATFGGLRELQEQLRATVPAYRGTELSMGMSNDYEIAVQEGSTIVRVGSALFGERLR